jgi:hypothetical protein
VRKFKIDENLPIEVAEMLQQAGFDAAPVLGQFLGGEADSISPVSASKKSV